MECHQEVTLAMDIMFMNKIPFLLTISRKLHIGTGKNLANRQVLNVANSLKKVLQLFHRHGFRVTTILADPEFEPLQEIFPHIPFNLCTQDKHVPEIEHYTRTVKDHVRSGYNSLPFKWLTWLMLVWLVCNAVFWLNAFPHKDSISDNLSPCYLFPGKHFDYRKHIRLEFGSYVQTHEEHTNGMEAHPTGAICLSPSGNEQGGHYFMSLPSGQRILCDPWTTLPMPHNVIARVSQLAKDQGMPKFLTKLRPPL
jgi:hypothetical protein